MLLLSGGQNARIVNIMIVRDLVTSIVTKHQCLFIGCACNNICINEYCG